MIYTRTGDKGKTGLFDGSRVRKDSPLIEALGTVDELNAYLGVAVSEIQKSPVRQAQGKNQNDKVKIQNELLKIQNDLFEVGSVLADSRSDRRRAIGEKLKVRTQDFEKLIDSMTRELPPLRNFILPGGGKAGAELHVARTVARRAERRIVPLLEKNKTLSEVFIYLNRLSDLFLTMSRFVNFKEGKKETVWRSTN